MLNLNFFDGTIHVSSTKDMYVIYNTNLVL